MEHLQELLVEGPLGVLELAAFVLSQSMYREYMAVYAVFNVDDEMINLVEWNGVSEWAPPEGCTVELYNQETMGVFNAS